MGRWKPPSLSRLAWQSLADADVGLEDVVVVRTNCHSLDSFDCSSCIPQLPGAVFCLMRAPHLVCRSLMQPGHSAGAAAAAAAEAAARAPKRQLTQAKQPLQSAACPAPGSGSTPGRRM